MKRAASSALSSNHRNGVILCTRVSYWLFWIGWFIAHTTPNGSRSWPYRAPQNISFDRHDDLGTGIDGASPPGIDVVHHQREVERLRLLRRMPVLRIAVAEHDRAAIDMQVHMHGAAFVVHRMGCHHLCAERATVELRGLHRAVDLQIGNDAALHIALVSSCSWLGLSSCCSTSQGRSGGLPADTVGSQNRQRGVLARQAVEVLADMRRLRRRVGQRDRLVEAVRASSVRPSCSRNAPLAPKKWK